MRKRKAKEHRRRLRKNGGGRYEFLKIKNEQRGIIGTENNKTKELSLFF